MAFSSDWTVIKLGGSSQCKLGYDALFDYLESNTNTKFVIVLSAPCKVTNLLEHYTTTKNSLLISDIYNIEVNLCTLLNISYSDDHLVTPLIPLHLSLNAKENLHNRAKIIGSGETISTRILYDYFTSKNKSVTYVSSYQFIKSKKETFKLYPSVEFYGDLDKFNRHSCNSNIIICEGFIGSSPNCNPVLLGRGGSDFTGSIIAEMLNAKEYQNWTNVNGIFSCDPRIVPNAKKIDVLDYELCSEISEMGANILHPTCLKPCLNKNIPIIVKNTFDIDGPNTLIKKINYDTETSPIIIAVQNYITLFKMTSLQMYNTYGFMNDIFRRFSENKVDVNIVTTSPISVYTTTDEKNELTLKILEADLEDKYQVEVVKHCSVVTIISSNIRHLVNKLNFNLIDSHIIHFGCNNLTLNFVVDYSKSANLAAKLHEILIG